MSARKRSRRKTDHRRQEALGVVVLMAGLFLLLSLLSYSPTDPPAAFDSARGGPSNWMGLLGARVAYGMVEQLGRIPPLLLIFLFFLWGWRLLRHQVDRDLVYLSLKVLGIQVLLSVLLAFPHFLVSSSISYDAAGQIGGGLAGILVTYTGVVGAPIIWLGAVVLFLMAAFDLKPGSLASGTAEAFSRTAHAAGAAGSGITSLFRGLLRLVSGSLALLGRLTGRLRGKRPAAPQEGPAQVGTDTAPTGGPQTVETPSVPVRESPAGPEPPLESGADEEGEEEPVADDLEPAPQPPRGSADYTPPPLKIFSRPAEEEMGIDEETMEQQGQLLEEKLASFGVKAEVVGWETGPIITRFEVKPSPGVKVSQIVNLADDLALAMRAKRIRIMAPIPGKAAVGVEIPNPTSRIVRIREILESEGFNQPDHTMPLALGHTISGEPFSVDLARMPHLLIAGTTGSGKSVCINALVASLLYRMGPEECRFILIDPKMLELGIYNSIPHLITPVVTDPKKAVDALKWTVLEMEDRFNTLAQAMVRDVDQYNAKLASLREKAEAEGDEERLAGIPDPLPYLVVVVDELADLMATATADIEGLIQRIAQKARAVGIHLVLATQRPSVDVITGPIKANLSTRIAFQVASHIDSKVILDTKGAEKLLGRGDMLYSNPALPEPMRIHGAFLSNEEIERLVNFVSGQELETEEQDIFSASGDEVSGMGAAGEELDDMIREAAHVVVSHDQGSISLIQRRLAVGYTRAARMMDQLEMLGVVGPPDGTKARDVLMSEEDLEDMAWGGR